MAEFLTPQVEVSGALPDEPSLLQRLARLSSYGTRQQQLQQLLGRNYQLRQPSGQRYSTGFGAALGGAGDILREIGGIIGERKIQSQLAALNAEQERGAQELGQQLQTPIAQP